MPRSRFADLMQSHRFWLTDVVPSSTFPFLVLGAPFLGFQSITTPEYTADVEEIKQLNSMFKKHVYTGGSAGNITLTRGVRAYDDTMWDWMQRAIKGYDNPNRHLLLLHFTSIGTTNDEIGVEAWESIAFLPGKAWLLWDAIPVRYKAGTDFNATDGSVSIAELEISINAFTEFTLLDPV